MSDDSPDSSSPLQPGPDRPIYTLSVASEILETHPRTLMLYETVGLVTPSRTPTNRRRYTQRDIERLRMIQTLTRRLGVNLASARYLVAMLHSLREHRIGLPEGLRALERHGLSGGA
ncbi:MAG: MerR family transcriptional regulator [Candidatus Dormibacteraeota bacterium]|nr:MerR family transcriptional regulator [Candidatus Dormibacteraeota bacterium]